MWNNKHLPSAVEKPRQAEVTHPYRSAPLAFSHSLLGLLERLGTVGRGIDVRVVDAVVVIQAWLAEDHGDRIASGHIIGASNPVHANICRVTIRL